MREKQPRLCPLGQHDLSFELSDRRPIAATCRRSSHILDAGHLRWTGSDEIATLVGEFMRTRLSSAAG